ncbi:LppA family lipoprotein [Mycoplasma capricolum]|uniref:LppA family lipoprotein n=1 Tax=Mycoplasma capricolum TaxID=2095 RepID=UPI003DA2E98B
MKITTKLLLSILPISSISLLSLVSCSTTSSNNKKPEENRTDKTPEKEPEKLPENSKKPENTETNDQHEPSKSDSEKKPNTSDNKNNIEPKKPDSERENTDQPQADQPNHHNVDFSDLEKIKTKLSYKSIKLYSDKDPRSAWFSLKNDLETFSNIFYRENKDLKNKYNLSFENNEPIYDFLKGVIDNVKVKFTNNKHSKIISFTLTDFKKTNTITNNKENYIKEKDELDNKFKGLYPSLVAFMLLYSEDPQSYKSLEQRTQAIGFEDLYYSNRNLFNNEYPGINQVTKKLLLEYNYDLSKIYKDRIIQAKFDDTKGTLGVKIEISNNQTEPKITKEPTLIKEFNIKGFRSINFKDENKNVLSMTLLQSNLKEMIKKGSLKKTVELLRERNNSFGVKMPLEQVEGTRLKDELFKYLLVNVDDNSYHIYNPKQTLSLQKNSKNDNTSILGLAGNMSIYPFHTRITKESINKIFITLAKEDDDKLKVTIDFEVIIPIYSVGYSDLKSPGTGASIPLTLKVNSSALID